jgi:uncharacterized repeat protein (TIGR02543 family)
MLKRKYAYLFVIASLVLLLSLVGLTGCPGGQTYTLTTNVSPPGAGSVSPSGGDYDSGMSVTLTATPASGYTFDHWGGSATGTNPTTTLIMNSDKSVTAYFEQAGSAVLLSDDFSDPGSGWTTYDDYDGQVAYRDGYLYLKDYTAYEGTIYSDAQLYLADFILEVETWMIGGNDDNWHLVQCRCQDNDNYYDLGISADGYYEIIRFANGKSTALAEPTYSSHINQGVGAVNLIHVECIGSSLSISVNGHLLETVTDGAFSSGYISLAANALAGTYTEVAFDNIIVTEP